MNVSRLTAVFADHLLAHPQLLEDDKPHLRDLWLRHSSEDWEHRSATFDLYIALGGGLVWWRRRIWTFSLSFAVNLLRQTVLKRWHDGSVWQLATWVRAGQVVFGQCGLLRETFGPWRCYLADDFHPSSADSAAGRRWLAEHSTATPAA